MKTSSRRLDQDQYIHLGHTSSRRLQDVFKTSSRCLAKMSSRRFKDLFKKKNVLKTSCKYVLKTSSSRFQDVLEDEKLLRWRRIEDVLKTSWRPTNVYCVLTKCDLTVLCYPRVFCNHCTGPPELGGGYGATAKSSHVLN